MKNSEMAPPPIDEVLIRGPKMLKFSSPDKLDCVACGATHIGWFAMLIVTLWSRRAGVMDVSICKGGREPTETIKSPLEMMVRGKAENDVPCAGIMEPHLHVTCKDCGHTVFMKTKQRTA